MNCKKRLLSAILAALMMLGMFSSVFAESTVKLNGDGTVDNPYVIKTEAELCLFGDMVNSTDNAAFCAVLDDDISLTKSWEPISSKKGYVTTAYAGTFDGKNHKISGLSINSTSSNVGFFSAVNGATVKNLQIEGTVSSSNNYVGGIVGKVQQGNIENCSFKGTVTTTKSGGNAGGIVGGSGNSKTQTACISKCANISDVSGGVVGGIVGYAKYTTISDCYNSKKISGSSRCGGIVGNLQNSSSAENCYSIGTLEGDGTKGDICGFNGSAVKNCFYVNDLNGASSNSATDDKCEKIVDAESLCQKLGDAFVNDTNNINNGYPVLAWQSGNNSESNTPSVKITGNSVLKMNNSGDDVFGVLSVQTQNIPEDTAFIWSVKSGADAVRIQQPENADSTNKTAIVYAVTPGKATIAAKSQNGEYTAEFEVSVYPFITTVEIYGTVAVGNTINAKVNVLGGSEYDYDNFPALKYQWKYLTEKDYTSGNTGYAAYKTISDASDRKYTISEELENAYISVDVLYNGETKSPSSPKKIVSVQEGYAIADAASLNIDTSDIKSEKNVTLPSKGSNGSDISWSSDNENIINSQSGKVTLPQSGTVEILLTANIKYGENSSSQKRTFKIKVYSVEQAEKEKNDKLSELRELTENINQSKLVPQYGQDTNIITMFKSVLNRDDIDVSIDGIKTNYDGGEIKEDGTIKYYYKNPGEDTAVHFASCDVTFLLSIDDASVKYTIPVIICHDVDKVKDVLRKEIVSETTLSADGKIITDSDLTLPKIADDKKWATISWTSSNENILEISNEKQQTADTLFEPYVGKVNRGIKDEKISLTAVYTYNYTNIADENPITLVLTYEVTVKALDEDGINKKRAELAEKLEKGFEKSGIRDAVSGEQINGINGAYTVKNDILFPTTADFGVDGKYMPVKITADNAEVIHTYDVNNAARVEVIRPAPGKENAIARITVSLEEKGTGISAEKTFKICVLALTEDEINAEKQLMNKVVAAYFDGIKGYNESAENIFTDLSPFCEVYEKEGELVWVRQSSDAVNYGIVPAAMKGWEELEAWRLFKSSNPAVVTHEKLLVNMQKNAKKVTVSSCLSSEVFGKYGELYISDPEKYADYETLADLYCRDVSAELVVRGKTTGKYNAPVAVEETIDVSFTLKGPDGDFISEVEVKNLPETSTAFDVFKKVLGDNNYTYKSTGTGYGVYITSVTSPSGETVAEFSYGKNSGWMYKINGYFADVAMTACGLEDGDEINVFFSKDYMNEDYSKPEDEEKTHTGSSSSTKKDDNSEDDENNSNDEKITYDFDDIKGHWAEKEIAEICNLGIMNGVDSSKFGPDEELTRAMLITVLYRLENEPNAEYADFDDVIETQWYAKAVGWAYENGIINGVSENEFAPDDVITREQTAAVIYRYVNYKKYNTNANENEDMVSYNDFDDISDYALDAFKWNFANQIITGKTENSLNPQDSTTRAEFAVMLLRFLKIVE